MLYKKKPNQNLGERGVAIAETVFDSSKGLLDGILEFADQKQVKKDDYYVSVYLLCLALLYLIVDRQVFSTFSEMDRAVMMSNVDERTNQLLTQELGLKSEKQIQGITGTLNENIMSLGPYDLLPGNMRYGTNTVFWELGRRLVEEYNFDFQVVPFLAITSVDIMTTVLQQTGLLKK